MTFFRQNEMFFFTNQWPVLLITVLYNGDQGRVDRGNEFSEFYKSAHFHLAVFTYLFIHLFIYLFAGTTWLFSPSGRGQRSKNKVP